MRTFDLIEAASFLKMHPEEVRRRAKLGLLPGAKPGKSWIFLEDDLAEYVRSLYAVPRQALQVTPRKEQQSCHLSNAVTRGGSISPRQQASALDVLLEQVTKSKHKNYTTS
ncbi:helix-turn-helix domain-containing protein [Undibacterium sp. Ren11W]|uniref:helix-turn-helix domain-containing protein n=1 Tax=Undibacterium sp. Ren11W TaxID=3413045 RepID=UPI003BF21419